ncbi:glutathione S-transferase family protein [Hephaestia sp. GCM10023244]|uniref:glutathione S-transferase family protein n=1 Tax=unclassified Hephaestia TaxID=2631281 RepID=UPI00207704FB|nr:glutathione S-transferase family protein [Hephaestia sp. MAHUQ-44]MCM8732048.1 glutathione S-transferase family protein [Hephaestia sp. MAHUQ-44]
MNTPAARMKLHWSPSSPYVRKVMLVAHELGLADRIDCVRAVVGPARLNPEVMADNPLNKIPTLIDGATVLFDSRVICDYLDALDGRHRMLPATGPARWTALRRQALADGLIEIAVLLRDEHWRGDGHRSPAHLQAFWAKIPACLDRLEAEQLDDAEPDIGHIAIACALSYLDFRLPAQKWRTGRPVLAAWERRFAARPSAVATALVEAGKRPLKFYEME